MFYKVTYKEPSKDGKYEFTKTSYFVKLENAVKKLQEVTGEASLETLKLEDVKL